MISMTGVHALRRSRVVRRDNTGALRQADSPAPCWAASPSWRQGAGSGARRARQNARLTTFLQGQQQQQKRINRIVIDTSFMKYSGLAACLRKGPRCCYLRCTWRKSIMMTTIKIEMRRRDLIDILSEITRIATLLNLLGNSNFGLRSARLMKTAQLGRKSR